MTTSSISAKMAIAARGRFAPVGMGSNSSSVLLMIALLAAAMSIALGALAGFRPSLALAAIAGAVLVFVLVRLGRDASLIWLLVIPWQFLPGVSANILLNPWLWAALMRLATARRVDIASSSKLATTAVFLLPASYLLSGVFFGVAEPSLMTWIFSYLPLAMSLTLVPPNADLVRRHMFYLGVLMAVLVIIEAITGFSSNQLIQSNISVQEYMRSGRSLGITGNPLFTSSVLMVAFFLPPKTNMHSMIGRLLIVLAIVLTGSKSAIIGLVLGALLFAVSGGLRQLAMTTGVIIGVLVGLQTAADHAFGGIFRRFAVFSDLRNSDPDRAFTTDFVWNWIGLHPAGGNPIGSALIDKRMLSPVAGGSRFGIESTWLAMAADCGAIMIGLSLLLVGAYTIRHRFSATVQALFALVVSLFFWNGLFGAWIITPLFLLLVLSPPESPLGSGGLVPDTENSPSGRALRL